VRADSSGFRSVAGVATHQAGGGFPLTLFSSFLFSFIREAATPFLEGLGKMRLMCGLGPRAPIPGIFAFPSVCHPLRRAQRQ